MNSVLSSKQNMQVHTGLMLSSNWRGDVNNLNPSDWSFRRVLVISGSVAGDDAGI